MTAKRVTQPILQNIGPRWYRLHEKFTYEWVKEGVRRRIVVPAGFECDGASIPWWAWSKIRLVPTGIIGAAAALHDFMYANRGDLPDGSYLRVIGPDECVPLHDVWSRYNADRLLCRVMRESGVPWLKRRIVYRSVRIFGGIPWARHKRALAARLPA